MYSRPYNFKWNSLHNAKVRKLIIQENTLVCSNTQEYQISEYVLKHCLFLHVNKRHSWKWSEKNWNISKGSQYWFYHFHAIRAICEASIFSKECMLAFRLLTWMVLTRMLKKTYLEMNFTIFLWCVFIFFSLCIYKRVYGGIQGAHMEVAHM